MSVIIGKHWKSMWSEFGDGNLQKILSRLVELGLMERDRVGSPEKHRFWKKFPEEMPSTSITE
jgi:hypothetical protein